MLSEELLKLLVCPMGKVPLTREGETLVARNAGLGSRSMMTSPTCSSKKLNFLPDVIRSLTSSA